jgi:predicted ATPase/class 3 adenylate cyclase
MMPPVRRDLPSGTVTFLFTDVEGSTRLLHELGAEEYAGALAEHRRVIREACARHKGIEVDTQGDAFFLAFPTAPGALAAAGEMTNALASGRVQVRIGLHTGTPLLTEEGYVGDDVHLAARVAASGHGGQVVLSAATAGLVQAELTDLGEHRLKDIAHAVPVYQLGDGSFPPLKTISNTNLPRPASSFIGREAELADVVGRIESGTRLLTLTGPGGSGKTRLALEAAATLVPDYKAGVFWVGLAALRDPSLVTETIAQTLGSKNGLAEHIGEREILLLLDNLEQVIEAAPELSVLITACPNLCLVVTSRELLRVQGEVDYPVPPLASPEAVSLFCARAQLEPSEEISELCARLDNLPLAVELAAARTKALTPARILERLSQRLDLLKGGRDADPRQQTLRATIEWSYELLSPDERELFARLSVFAGGCTLEAAEEICEASLDTLQSLVEKSLLRFTPSDTGGRYWMLETIREYAGQRLDESSDAGGVRRRHAERSLALAESLPRDAPVTREWLAEMEAEHDNLRAALDEFEAVGESQIALRMAGALGRFWFSRGHVIEAGHRLDRVLLADEAPTAARARALHVAAMMALTRGDVATGEQRDTDALDIYRKLGDAWGVAYCTYGLGHAAVDAADWTMAQQRFDESLRAFRELGDVDMALAATDILGFAYRKLGQRERAQELAACNLVEARAARDEGAEATALGALGLYAVEDGRVEEAVPLLVESTRLWRAVAEDWDEVVLNVCSFARALATEGRAEVAAQLLSAAASLHEERGAAPRIWLEPLNEGTLAIIRGQLDPAAFDEAWGQGRSLSLDEAVALALAEIESDA